MNDRVAMLRDLDSCHLLALSALADLDLERGEVTWAAGWRWLAEAGRWPIFVRDVDEGDAWEWWRDRDDRSFSCCLPRLLMDHVRRASKTKSGKTCRFDKAGAALACAAFCAGTLINLFGSVEETEPRKLIHPDSENEL